MRNPLRKSAKLCKSWRLEGESGRCPMRILLTIHSFYNIDSNRLRRPPRKPLVALAAIPSFVHEITPDAFHSVFHRKRSPLSCGWRRFRSPFLRSRYTVFVAVASVFW